MSQKIKRFLAFSLRYCHWYKTYLLSSYGIFPAGELLNVALHKWMKQWSSPAEHSLITQTRKRVQLLCASLCPYIVNSQTTLRLLSLRRFIPKYGLSGSKAIIIIKLHQSKWMCPIINTSLCLSCVAYIIICWSTKSSFSLWRHKS